MFEFITRSLTANLWNLSTVERSSETQLDTHVTVFFSEETAGDTSDVLCGALYVTSLLSRGTTELMRYCQRSICKSIKWWTIFLKAFYTRYKYHELVQSMNVSCGFLNGQKCMMQWLVMQVSHLLQPHLTWQKQDLTRALLHENQQRNIAQFIQRYYSPSVFTAICLVSGGGRLMHTRSTSGCSSTSSIRLV